MGIKEKDEYYSSMNVFAKFNSEYPPKEFWMNRAFSTLGYYHWKNRKPSNQTKRQARIKEAISSIHQESD